MFVRMAFAFVALLVASTPLVAQEQDALELKFVLVHVDDVQKAAQFYQDAFGLMMRLRASEGGYIEFETGATVLALVERSFANTHLPKKLHSKKPNRGVEIALITKDVQGAWQRAVAAGASPIIGPKQQPWGQEVAWVQCPEGTLVEIASPMNQDPTQPDQQSQTGNTPQAIFLAVADLGVSKRFYQEAFGWPIAFEQENVIVQFTMPGGVGLALYTHGGFQSNTAASIAKPLPEQTSGTELYIHVSDLDAVIGKLESMSARLLSARAPRPWGDVAAYFADPDGNVLAVAQPQ